MTQTPLGPRINNDNTQDLSTRNDIFSRNSGFSIFQNDVSDGVESISFNEVLAGNENRNLFGGTTALRYPEKLASSDNGEQPHWLKILIRVREQNSQAVGGQTTGAVYTETTARRLDQESAAGTLATVGTLGGAGVGAAAVGGVARAVFRSAATIPLGNLALKVGAAVTGGAAGAVAGAGAGGIVAKISGSNKSTTLTTSIALGLQEPPKAEYSVVYEEQALGSILSGGKQGMFNTLKGVAGETLRRGINPGKLGEVAGVNKAAASAAVEKSLGKIRNPYREQMFKQVDFREFTIEYIFLPESVNEAKTVLQIIKLLRQNMLPEVAQNSFYMIYPAEFSLFYMYKNNLNQNVHQFSDCVLTGMTLKYGGQDFVTFKGTNGVPAEIAMTLKFREIVPLTGDRVMGENL